MLLTVRCDLCRNNGTVRGDPYRNSGTDSPHPWALIEPSLGTTNQAGERGEGPLVMHLMDVITTNWWFCCDLFCNNQMFFLNVWFFMFTFLRCRFHAFSSLLSHRGLEKNVPIRFTDRTNHNQVPYIYDRAHDRTYERSIAQALAVLLLWKKK